MIMLILIIPTTTFSFERNTQSTTSVHATTANENLEKGNDDSGNSVVIGEQQQQSNYEQGNIQEEQTDEVRSQI